MGRETHTQIYQVLQSHNGRILGYLIRLMGNFDDAEDICQDVLESALNHWQENGIPDNPLAWLHTAAKNRATDQFRHQKITGNAEALLIPDSDTTDKNELLDQSLEDDLLRLIFTCCHPALSENVRVPLTLKLITGLSLEEVASAFLIAPRTMEQRLVRAKRKIQSAGIAYEVPSGQQLGPRVDSVMQTLYLMFNEGYFATSGKTLMRSELCREAIRLATIMQRLFPGRAELMSLLALMLLQDSRSEARIRTDGGLILLQDQNRVLWNKRMIAQGSALLDKALHLRQPPGRYQLQASIAALHVEAKTPDATDWNQIALLYRRLLEMEYTPVLHLNYAVAVAMSGNVEHAMKELTHIEVELENYFPFYCARADFHQKTGAHDDCINDYQRALTLTDNESEQGFVQEQLETLISK